MMSDNAKSSQKHCHATTLKPLADNDVTGQCLYGPILESLLRGSYF